MKGNYCDFSAHRSKAATLFFWARASKSSPLKPIFLDEVNFRHQFVRRFAKLKYKVMKSHVVCACMRQSADKNASQRNTDHYILSAQREIDTSLGTGTTRDLMLMILSRLGSCKQMAKNKSFSSKFASAGMNHRKKSALITWTKQEWCLNVSELCLRMGRTCQW